MVDVAISQAIVRRLNRWYRGRSQPRGTVDHTYRGIRLAYNSTYRLVTCFMSGFLLIPTAALFFWHDLFADKPPLLVLALKIGWAGLLVVVFLAPLQAFREFLIANDEGIMKSGIFGKQTRAEWKEIRRVQSEVDGNEITFWTTAGGKLKASLAYDGWQEFLETSAKHLDPGVQSQLEFAVGSQIKQSSNLQAI